TAPAPVDLPRLRPHDRRHSHRRTFRPRVRCHHGRQPASPASPPLIAMPAASPPPVHFDAVSKRFGDTGPRVLDHIQFTANPRDFVAVIGPSGCGKSTLLRLIAGLTPVTAGTLS